MCFWKGAQQHTAPSSQLLAISILLVVDHAAVDQYMYKYCAYTCVWCMGSDCCTAPWQGLTVTPHPVSFTEPSILSEQYIKA